MNQLSVSIIKNLLYEDEGTALDFKREQYKFDGASKGEKSELLKDVLAFTNSWRRSTAYILIGVAENQGVRCEVIGISYDLDDAKLQQFVSSKTNRPVTFAYRTFSIEGKSIGAIEIPVQDRPVYLTLNFGKLEKETVYIRRGSSTAIAAPDEIARMGLSSSEISPPELSLEWADLADRIILPSPCQLKAILLDPKLPDDTFSESGTGSGYQLLRSFSNPNYSKEIINYTFSNHFLQTLGFRLRNESETVAKRVRFVGSVKNQTGIVIQDWEDRPKRPYRDTLLGLHENIVPLSEQLRSNPDPSVQAYKGYCEITIDFGDIRPHDEVWTTTPILVGAINGGAIVVDGELRGDNLPRPVPRELEARFEVTCKPMEHLDVLQCIEKVDPE